MMPWGRFRYWSIVLLSFVGGSPLGTGFAADEAEQAALERFTTTVAPVLAAKCVTCHRPDNPKGGLDLSTREAMLRGGESGPALTVAKPDESPLYSSAAVTWQRLQRPLNFDQPQAFFETPQQRLARVARRFCGARRMIVTVQQHILQEQKRFPGASGEFSWLLSAITLATKMIQARVRRAGLTDILSSAGEINVQGETQQKLDVYANEALLHCLSTRASVGVIASEENEAPVILAHGSPAANYAIVFDPLDGSSNIDVNVSVGTTFSILRRPENSRGADPEEWILQPGSRQVAAGYVVYGSSTILVYSIGDGAHGFTLDPAVGAYVLSHPNLRMPEQGKYYSVNEAYADTFPPPYREYIERLRLGALGRRYGTRYIGSMVADFHRTLLKGGVFLYPPTNDYPQGKLRLLYEANPIAFITEQAGGVALAGARRVLDIQPESIHERTPLAAGSQREMRELQRLLGEPGA